MVFMNRWYKISICVIRCFGEQLAPAACHLTIMKRSETTRRNSKSNIASKGLVSRAFTNRQHQLNVKLAFRELQSLGLNYFLWRLWAEQPGGMSFATNSGEELSYISKIQAPIAFSFVPQIRTCIPFSIRSPHNAVGILISKDILGHFITTC